MNRPDGYRYVRSYKVKGNVTRWALWEVQDGRARRVGTAFTEGAYRAFLWTSPPLSVRARLDRAVKEFLVRGDPQ